MDLAGAASTPVRPSSTAELRGMSSPSPFAIHHRHLIDGGGERSLRSLNRYSDDDEAKGGYGTRGGGGGGDDDDDDDFRVVASSSGGNHHDAGALPNSRSPLHRRKVHSFLRGRELLRTTANLYRRPGVNEFVADGRGVGCGIIPIVPPHTGVGSPPFVVRFCGRGLYKPNPVDPLA
jgi:denticleless